MSTSNKLKQSLSVLIVLFLVAPLLAQDEEDGGFTVRSAEFELISDVYYVNAIIDLRLSSEARAALESGVPLIVHI